MTTGLLVVLGFFLLLMLLVVGEQRREVLLPGQDELRSSGPHPQLVDVELRRGGDDGEPEPVAIPHYDDLGQPGGLTALRT
jgi:hypothetical protein